MEDHDKKLGSEKLGQAFHCTNISLININDNCCFL